MRCILVVADIGCQFIGLAGVAVMWTAAIVGCRLEDRLERDRNGRVVRLRRELAEAEEEAI